ncbi:hypothetical protein [uncultured Sphaerochaeta sp.]|uniref:hypothetical protein n=1 Tax=uncultured Sphaerochaeta sp. TaxID=886478 RepID=UPI002A0A2843|nr:hypothetical protein [uncultured Sphaerochaeta sp.]
MNPLTLTTAGYRMLFSGNTDINTWLPAGNLSLSNATDGNSLLAIDFAPLPPSTYSYSVTSPLENSFLLTGIVKHEASGNLSSQAKLSVRDKDYPLDVNFSPRTLEATLNSEKNLSVAASFVPPISLKVVANQFPLPTSSILQDSFLSGILNFNINDLYDWKIQTDLVKLTSVVLSGRQYSFSASLDAIPTKIQIKDISIQDSLHVFSGNLLYNGTRLQDNLKAGFSLPFTFYFILGDNSSQSISLALTNTGSNRIEGIALSEALDLGRLFPKLSGLLLNSSFVGYSNLSDDLDLDGNLQLTSSDAWNIPLSLQGDINAKDSLLTFGNALVSYGSSVLKDFSITLDTSNGILSSLGRFISTDKEGDPPRNTHFNFDVSLGLPKGNSFFAISNILDTAKNQTLHASLSLTDILLLGEKGIADGSYSLSYQDQTLQISSDLLSIDYNFGNHDLQATIDKQFGIGLDLSGILSPQNIHLEADNIFVPLSLLNRLFPKPIMSFLEGNVEGQLLFDGPSDNMKTYGQLFVDSSKLKVWWLPQDIISAKNITASFNGERGITPYFPFFSTNTTTGETVRGSGQLTASLKGFSIPSFQVNAVSTEGSIFVRLPLLDIDADVKSYASGSFELLGGRK